jgi:hypothetical protein
VRDNKLLLVCEGDRVSPGTFVVLDLEGRGEHVVPVGLYPDDLAVLPRQPTAGVP